jgi:hypothetical protein
LPATSWQGVVSICGVQSKDNSSGMWWWRREWYWTDATSWHMLAPTAIHSCWSSQPWLECIPKMFTYDWWAKPYSTLREN